MSTTPKLQNDILRATSILKEAGCSEVFLFGSAATGHAGAGSDLDLAVRGCPRGQFFHLLGKLLMALEHPVDLVDLDAQEAFAQHLESEGDLVRIG